MQLDTRTVDEEFSEMQRYEAYTRWDLGEDGLTEVIFTRTNAEGKVRGGVFLVDRYCLGVKNAFLMELTAAEWPDQLDFMLPSKIRMAIHPACARKLVEGAVAYAQALGFAPHRDFHKAKRIFGSATARECTQEFTYGLDGKPHYFAGPKDTEQRIDLVLRILTAKLGADGFGFTGPAEASIADLL